MKDVQKLFYGDSISINDKIKIKHPRIGEVLDFGEEAYFNFIHTFCIHPCSVKHQLYDAGILFDEVDEFFTFLMFYGSLPKEGLSILIDGVDFSALKVAYNNDTEEYVLWDGKSVVYDSLIHERVLTQVRYIHWMEKVKNEVPANDYTRMNMIEMSREDAFFNSKKEYKPRILSNLIFLRCQGFSKSELFDMPIFEFFTLYHTIVSNLHKTAITQGYYSGVYNIPENLKGFKSSNLALDGVLI